MRGMRLVLVGLVAMSGGRAWGQYSGGSGTVGSPYQISTAADWKGFAWRTSQTYLPDQGMHFVLTEDIDLSEVQELRPAAQGEWGNYTFTGVLDGQGHVISGARIDLPNEDYVGLFGWVGADVIRSGVVRNLAVEDVYVRGRSNVGGLVGGCSSAYGDGGRIENCYVTGTVIGSGECIGGLAGWNDGEIDSCYSKVSVTGGDLCGGLVGASLGSIDRCYSIGAVTGSGDARGLVGVGGGARGCFWDVESSGRVGSMGGKGLTTAQMKTLRYFRNAGWSFTEWVMVEGEYPRLAWEGAGWAGIGLPDRVPLQGAGTESSPYEVWTAADWAALSWYAAVLDKHTVLKADLDLTGVDWEPVGELGAFEGVFDGGGHAIRGAVLDRPEDVGLGLWEHIGQNGIVRNLRIEEITVQGEGMLGALAGSSYGHLRDCRATGRIEGEDTLGGLVGEQVYGSLGRCEARCVVNGSGGHCGGLIGSANNTLITACGASGEVHGGYYAGGLVGRLWFDAEIRDSYASGPVDGGGRIGGLVGNMVMGGLVVRSYAVGKVTATGIGGGLVALNQGGEVEDGCFWDVEATGQEASEGGGTGLGTAAMQMAGTYAGAGWDFADVWAICERMNYPRLRWQIGEADVACPFGVGLADYAALAGAWLARAGEADWDGRCDLDGSGMVDVGDLAVLCGSWLAE